jgi:predicted phosphodiesterase
MSSAWATRPVAARMVRGNTDEWLLSGLPKEGGDAEIEMLEEIVAWGRERLSAEDRAFLRGLPRTLELALDETNRLLGFHRTPRGTTERLLHTMPDSVLAERLGDRTARVLAGGHTHLQGVRGHRGALLLNPRERRCAGARRADRLLGAARGRLGSRPVRARGLGA